MKEHFTLPGRDKDAHKDDENAPSPETRHPAYAPEPEHHRETRQESPRTERRARAKDTSRTEAFDRRALEKERLMSYDEDGQLPPSAGGGGHSPSSVRLFAAVALLFIIPLAAGVYLSGTLNKGDKDIPLIKADTDPVRVKPDNPGGFLIEHQEKSVYETLNGTDTGELPEVMKILPATEMPANLAETDEGHTLIEDVQGEPERMITEASEPPRIVRLTQDGKVPVTAADIPPATVEIPNEVLTMAELVDEVAVSEDIVEEAVAEVIVQPVTPGGVIPVVILKGPVPTLFTKPRKEASLSRAETVTTAVKKTLPPAAGDNRMLKAGAGGRYVQLGAFSNIADAKRRFDAVASTIRASMSSAKVDYYFQPVAVRGKGTLYRLKIGEFAGDASARAFCKTLMNKKIECLYVGN